MGDGVQPSNKKISQNKPPIQTKFICFVQARMNSSRFPGKVLRKIGSKPLLQIVIDRIKNSKKVDLIVVLTSTNPKDIVIAEYCKRNSIKFFQGSENDVLHRFYEASSIYIGSHYLRINSDCPFIDWHLIDKTIEIAKKTPNLDYVTTILSNTYPIGQHVEVIRRETLLDINNLAKESLEREHVTPYIYNNRDEFNIFSLSSNTNLSSIRLTIDYPEDFLMTEKLISECSEILPSYKKIIDTLENYPEINLLNNKFIKSQFIDLQKK